MREMPSKWFTLMAAYYCVDPFGSEMAKHVDGSLASASSSEMPELNIVEDATDQQLAAARNRMVYGLEQQLGIRGTPRYGRGRTNN
mgnify:CR=1 FL=1